MPAFSGEIVDLFMSRWQNATLIDYGHAVLAVVIVAWLITRLRRE